MEDFATLFKQATRLAVLGEIEEAKQAFEKAREGCKDEKLSADNAEWLMSYYLGKGDKKTAKKIARHAYKVSTAAGIDTMGKYFERTGDLEAALRTYEEEWEHYGSDRLLLAFYLRNRDKDQYWKIRADEQVVKVFPKGLKQVELANFKWPPTRAVLILSGDDNLPQSPLTKDAVIVAINGHAVENVEQYLLAKELELSGNIAVIYWDGKKYAQCHKRTVQSNRLGLTIDDYKANLDSNK